MYGEDLHGLYGLHGEQSLIPTDWKRLLVLLSQDKSGSDSPSGVISFVVNTLSEQILEP